MKYSTIIGLLLITVGLILYIWQGLDYTDYEFYIAAILGGGIGLVLGGFMGYAQKKRKKVVKTTFETKPESTFKDTKVEIKKDDDSGLKL